MSAYRPYPKYKPSGVEWLGDVPEHWEVIKLRYLCYITTGNRDTENAIEDGQYPFFVRSQTIEKINEFTHDCEAILTAGDGVGVGKVFHYFQGKFTAHQRVYILNHFVKVRGKYLYSYFSGLFHKVALAGDSKSTVDSLRRNNFTDFSVCLPPSPEQIQIAAFLDRECGKLDDLQAKQEQLIELLKEKRQALISHAVTKGLDPKAKLKPSGIEWLGDVPEGWVVTRLRYVIRDLESGVSVNSTDTPADSDQLGVLKTSCVYTRQFRSDENKAVVLEELDRVRCPVKKNCLIISRMNTPELVGATGFVDRDFPNLFLPDRLWQTIFYHPSEEIARFFSYVMSLKGFRDEIGMISTGTSSSMKNIAKEDLLGLTVALPPSSELCAIVTHLEMKCSKVDNLIAKAESAISLMKERRSALISAAVTGKIDVREHSN